MRDNPLTTALGIIFAAAIGAAAAPTAGLPLAVVCLAKLAIWLGPRANVAIQLNDWLQAVDNVAGDPQKLPAARKKCAALLATILLVRRAAAREKSGDKPGDDAASNLPVPQSTAIGPVVKEKMNALARWVGTSLALLEADEFIVEGKRIPAMAGGSFELDDASQGNENQDTIQVTTKFLAATDSLGERLREIRSEAGRIELYGKIMNEELGRLSVRKKVAIKTRASNEVTFSPIEWTVYLPDASVEGTTIDHVGLQDKLTQSIITIVEHWNILLYLVKDPKTKQLATQFFSQGAINMANPHLEDLTISPERAKQLFEHFSSSPNVTSRPAESRQLPSAPQSHFDLESYKGLAKLRSDWLRLSFPARREGLARLINDTLKRDRIYPVEILVSPVNGLYYNQFSPTEWILRVPQKYLEDNVKYGRPWADVGALLAYHEVLIKKYWLILCHCLSDSRYETFVANSFSSRAVEAAKHSGRILTPEEHAHAEALYHSITSPDGIAAAKDLTTADHDLAEATADRLHGFGAVDPPLNPLSEEVAMENYFKALRTLGQRPEQVEAVAEAQHVWDELRRSWPEHAE